MVCAKIKHTKIHEKKDVEKDGTGARMSVPISGGMSLRLEHLRRRVLSTVLSLDFRSRPFTEQNSGMATFGHVQYHRLINVRICKEVETNVSLLQLALKEPTNYDHTYIYLCKISIHNA